MSAALEKPPGLSDMAQEILEMITQRGRVSFAELARIEGFQGEASYELGDRNILLWAGMSLEACDAMQQLENGKHIEADPCSVIVYLADGLSLKLPIAIRPTYYKRSHWLPVVWSLPNPAKAGGGNGGR